MLERRCQPLRECEASVAPSITLSFFFDVSPAFEPHAARPQKSSATFFFVTAALQAAVGRGVTGQKDIS